MLKPNREIFAKNLKALIEMSGKSQKDIANDLGIPASVLSRYATGEMYPRIDKIQRIADYFGIRKSDLIEEKSEIKAKDNQVIADLVVRAKMDNTYMELLVETSKLDSSRLESILSVVKQFSNNSKN